MDFFDSLSRQGGPQKCGPPCLRPIVDRKEALADKTRGAAYQGKSNRLALSEGLNTAGAFITLNTLLRGVGKTAEQSGALVGGMQRDLAVVTSGGGVLAKSNAWNNLATSCGAARSALSSAGRMADHAVVKEMQNFLDVLGGTAAQAGGGNTPAAQKPGLTELFPQQEAPINMPWSAGPQTGAPGNPPLFLRENSLDEWNKAKVDNVLVRARGGGDEHIDSAIERMYNDTEMDHHPQPEAPEPIPPQDQQIIDDEWSGSIQSIFQLTPELERHILYVDPATPRKHGIGGAHNSEEFFKNDLQIVLSIPSQDILGVTYYKYNLPALGKDGKPIGGYGVTRFEKTVFDPELFSTEEYFKRGLEAASDAYKRGGTLPGYWDGYDSHGVKWIGYGKGGKPTSFFPDVPKQ